MLESIFNSKFFWVIVNFVLKILIKLTKISMNYQIIYFVNLFIFTKLFVLSPIFLATRSKCVSENFEKIKNSFAKTHLLKIFSSNYFFQVPIHKEFWVQKSTICHKIKISKIGKLMLHMSQNIVHLLGQKKNWPLLTRDILVNLLSILSSKSTYLKKMIAKIGKMFFSFFSAHCASFIRFWLLSRGREGRGGYAYRVW